jgi:hypothetical protein
MRDAQTPLARLQRPVRASRGAATLVVVMVLFFLVAMVAAYSNRSLVFDQRTAANQVRAAQSYAASEAGVDWAISQLNAGIVDSTCKPSTTEDDDAHRTFRDRHLKVVQTNDEGLPDGETYPIVNTNNIPIYGRCVFNGSDFKNPALVCGCSRKGVNVVPTRPAGSQPAPAFSIAFAEESAAFVDVNVLPKNTIRIISWGCSQVEGCFGSTPGADAGSSISVQYAQATLRPALRTQPGSAMTIGGNLTALPAGGFAGGNSIHLINDPQVALRQEGKTVPSGGVTISAGGTVAMANLRLQGMPGTPAIQTRVENDTALTLPALTAAAFPPTGLTSADRFFVVHFGMSPRQYFNQPAIADLDCTAPCDAAKVNQMIARNPGQAIRLTGAGGLLMDGDIGEENTGLNKPIGSGSPVVLIVEGPVATSPGVEFWGVIYGRIANWIWTVDGDVKIMGAILAEGNFTLVAGGTPPALTVDYSGAHDKEVFNFLRSRAGSYTRFTRGWRDWYAE